MAAGPFLLRQCLAPGDAVALTALARDLALAHPGARVGVATPYPAVWVGNPYVTAVDAREPGAVVVEPDYRPEIRRARLAALTGEAAGRVPYLRAFHAAFERLTGVPVPLTAPRPDLHLPDGPDARAAGKWLVCAGGKPDIPTKTPTPAVVAAAVAVTRRAGVDWLQVGAARDARWEHHHPRVPGAADLVGTTSLRDLVRLVAGCAGVLCGVSLPMLLAAAFHKPCVVLAGGVEDPWWFAQPGHAVFSAVDTLPCCQRTGCRLTQVVTPPGGALKNVTCLDAVPAEGGWGGLAPRCHAAVDPAAVAAAILGFTK